jgi:hypothetical protein
MSLPRPPTRLIAPVILARSLWALYFETTSEDSGDVMTNITINSTSLNPPSLTALDINVFSSLAQYAHGERAQ